MPLFYQQNINEHTRLGIWKIEEPEVFFLTKVSLQREITHPAKRLQHLAGRYLLPFLFPDFPNEDIKIASTRKPFLVSEKYHFSISHCSLYAAALVSDNRRTGIDVEMMTPRLYKIAHKFLNTDELLFVNAEQESRQLLLLSILWSAKEAMYKWYGNGEVDFREMMRTYPFMMNTNGQINAVFIKNELTQKLTLEYKLFNDLILVWVLSG